MNNELFTEFEDKKILILGFGKEGYSTYKLLRSTFPGKVIGVSDEKGIDEFDVKQGKVLKNDKFLKLNLGKNYLDDLENYDVIIKSPGIPSKSLKLTKAKQHDFVLSFGNGAFGRNAPDCLHTNDWRCG